MCRKLVPYRYLAKNIEGEVKDREPYKSTVLKHRKSHQGFLTIFIIEVSTHIIKSLRQYNEVLTVAIAR